MLYLLTLMVFLIRFIVKVVRQAAKSKSEQHFTTFTHPTLMTTLSAADTASEHSVIAGPKQQSARPPPKIAAQTRRVQMLRQALGRWIDEWGAKAVQLLAETIGIAPSEPLRMCS